MQEELEDKIYKDIERMTLRKGMDLRSQARYYAGLIAKESQAAYARGVSEMAEETKRSYDEMDSMFDASEVDSLIVKQAVDRLRESLVGKGEA